MGFCLYGNDIDDTTSPIEAGLNWLTKFVDGKEFIDRKLMEEQKAGGLTRKLVGFKMIDRGIPRHGYQIASPEGDIIGQVTSGTMSPCLKQGIGMGYVKKEFAKVGTQIAIVIREKLDEGRGRETSVHSAKIVSVRSDDSGRLCKRAAPFLSYP